MIFLQRKSIHLKLNQNNSLNKSYVYQLKMMSKQIRILFILLELFKWQKCSLTIFNLKQLLSWLSWIASFVTTDPNQFEIIWWFMAQKVKKEPKKIMKMASSDSRLNIKKTDESQIVFLKLNFRVLKHEHATFQADIGLLVCLFVCWCK